MNNKKSLIKTLLNYKDSKTKFAILIGPEGGFSENEKTLIEQKEFVIPVSLGSQVLRSDTAITVALYCLQEIII